MELIDIEMSFLNGILEEEIYMEIPKGMNLPKIKYLLLQKNIYGLVQAARQWWKTFTKFLVDNLEFHVSEADQCLLWRTNG